jgi:hypothetical protein
MTMPQKSDTDDKPRMMALTFRRSWLVFLLAATVASACDLPPPEGAVEVPCDGDEGTVLELGLAAEIAGRYGLFSTTGATVWVTSGRIDTGPIFDVDQTSIEVGWASEPPEQNELTGGEAADVLTQVSVKEGYWSPLELEEGDYWLWLSNGGEVTIQTCAVDAIFDPVPVTFPFEPGG